MKKNLTILGLIIYAIAIYSQSPQKMTYQAVIRNSSNDLVAEQDIGVQISILQGTENGLAVYTETHTTRTNANGLMTIEIGDGIGSDNFSAIDWSNGPFYIETKSDPTGGTDYTITGISQLLSVPYALYAETTESYNETDPVFGVSVAYGINALDTANWNRTSENGAETDPIWISDSANYYSKNNLQTANQAEVNWENIVASPTSLEGYGITDAAPIVHDHEIVTESTDGFMSAADKVKLEGLSSHAYTAGDGIHIENNEISTDITLRASYTGDTLVLVPGSYVFVPGLSNANSDLPVVTTNEVNNITSLSAYGHGIVTNYGNSVISEIGICWSINLSPTVVDDHISSGSTSGEFICVLESLTENTLYFARAYAISGSTVFYGDNVIFNTTDIIPVPTVSTTEVTGITETTALSGGYISENGGSDVTARGVCWNTSPAPTIDNSLSSNGTGNGLFTTYITGLTLNTQYYIRSYATNVNGTNYGPELIFKTTGTLPTVTTSVPQSVTETTAILGGEVTALGSASVTERGICYSTSANPTTSNSTLEIGTGTGTFNTAYAKLLPNTTYNVRAYAKNSVGTAYGSKETFTTLNAYYEGFENGSSGDVTGAWGINTTSYEGYYSVYTRQGGAATSLTRDLTSGGEITFYLQVYWHTGDSWSGYVSFYIDGELQTHIRTYNNWYRYSYPVTVGEHTFSWVYTSDTYNGAWLDYIVMPE